MKTGYIEYKDKLIKVEIVENKGGYLTVKTEDNEILGIPPESFTTVWPTKEMYERYKAHSTFVFMEDSYMSEKRLKHMKEATYISLQEELSTTKRFKK